VCPQLRTSSSSCCRCSLWLDRCNTAIDASPVDGYLAGTNVCILAHRNTATTRGLSRRRLRRWSRPEPDRQRDDEQHAADDVRLATRCLVATGSWGPQFERTRCNAANTNSPGTARGTAKASIGSPGITVSSRHDARAGTRFDHRCVRALIENCPRERTRKVSIGGAPGTPRRVLMQILCHAFSIRLAVSRDTPAL